LPVVAVPGIFGDAGNTGSTLTLTLTLTLAVAVGHQFRVAQLWARP